MMCFCDTFCQGCFLVLKKLSSKYSSTVKAKFLHTAGLGQTLKDYLFNHSFGGPSLYVSKHSDLSSIVFRASACKGVLDYNL